MDLPEKRDLYSRVRSWVSSRQRSLDPERDDHRAAMIELAYDDVMMRLSCVLKDDVLIDAPAFQGSFYIDCRSHLLRGFVLRNDFEGEFVSLCSQAVDPTRDCIDVGANVGLFSVFLAKTTQKRVLAIEPTTRALRLLERNLLRNSVDQKVIVQEGVAGEVEGTAIINFPDGNEEFSSTGNVVHPAAQRMTIRKKEVQSFPLDILVEYYSLDPGFIKVDVEGSEMSVLQGARETISKSRPVMLLELSDVLLKANGSSASDVLFFLRANQYRVFTLGETNNCPKTEEFGEILAVPIEMADRVSDWLKKLS